MTTKNNLRLLTVVSLSCALLGAACTTENICAEAPQQPDADIAQTENAAHELMVKFTPEAAEIIENSARTRGGELTRSGVVSVDEVLEAVEGYRAGSADFVLEKYDWNEVVNRTLELYGRQP